MPRYIDAYFAQQIADAELGSSDKGTVQWILAHTPTADVQEVRHGIWGKYESCSDGYRCSCCKLISRTCTAYCFHCGAKMDR